MNYLIIGGVAGGATVAARLRRMDEHANIVLFERGKYVSYANCGLPYYIGGTIADRNKLFVQSVEGFTRRFRIDIRTEQEVVRIDRAKRLVEVRRLATGELYTEPYDKLVLSVGAEPLRPPSRASTTVASSRCAACPTRMPSRSTCVANSRGVRWLSAADSSGSKWRRTSTKRAFMSTWSRWHRR